MDKIFKIGLLVLGFGYLAYLYCPHTNQVGRYQYHTVGDTFSIMDTTNADAYTLITKKSGGWVRLNPVTGKKKLITIKDE